MRSPDYRPEQKIDLREEQPHLGIGTGDQIIFRDAREDAFAAFKEAFGSGGRNSHGAKQGWRAEGR